MSLDRLIAEERTKITGDSNSVAAAQTEYERLDEARKLAEDAAGFGLQVVGGGPARRAAPGALSRDDRAAKPARFPALSQAVVSFSMVLATCLLAYGIAWLLVASVREHAAA